MGALTLVRDASLPPDLVRARRHFTPRSSIGRLVERALDYLPDDLAYEFIERITGLVVIECSLYGRLIRADGRVEDLGLLSRHVVTNNGVAYITGYMDGSNTGANLKYHGLGTNSTAEAASDSALGAELTTQYNPDNTRATGTAVKSTNTFTSVGTNTVDASAAVTEHGLFSASSSGTLFDRSVFSTVNLANGDSLQTTYVATVTAGG
jgi:hypothetical protein